MTTTVSVVEQDLAQWGFAPTPPIRDSHDNLSYMVSIAPDAELWVPPAFIHVAPTFNWQ